jgi:hypothetical protein
MDLEEARRVARDVFMDPSQMSPDEIERWHGRAKPDSKPGRLDALRDEIYDATRVGADPSRAAGMPALFEEYERLTGKRHPLRGMYAGRSGVVVRLAGVPVRYKGYVITHDPPPVPHRGADWQFAHQDFDGAPDSGDQRSGTAASLDDARRQIDEMEVEGIYRELRPDADPDPMARMYDLRKKGHDMTPEEDLELRGLIRRHGRPKFMSKDKHMTKQQGAKTDDFIARSVREVLKGYEPPTPEDPWQEYVLAYVWKDLMRVVHSRLADADSSLYGSQSGETRDLESFLGHLRRLSEEAEAKRRSPQSRRHVMPPFKSMQEMEEHVGLELGVDLSAPPAPPVGGKPVVPSSPSSPGEQQMTKQQMQSWVLRNCKFAADVGPSGLAAASKNDGVIVRFAGKCRHCGDQTKDTYCEECDAHLTSQCQACHDEVEHDVVEASSGRNQKRAGWEDEDDRDDFADPGGESALRADGPGNKRSLPCPTCKRPNMLTPKDKALGYQCDRCADAAERGVDPS